MLVRVDSDDDLTEAVPEFARVPAGGGPHGADWVPGSWSSGWSPNGFQLASSPLLEDELAGGDVWLRVRMVGSWLVASTS